MAPLPSQLLLQDVMVDTLSCDTTRYLFGRSYTFHDIILESDGRAATPDTTQTTSSASVLVLLVGYPCRVYGRVQYIRRTLPTKKKNIYIIYYIFDGGEFVSTTSIVSTKSYRNCSSDESTQRTQPPTHPTRVPTFFQSNNEFFQKTSTSTT